MKSQIVVYGEKAVRPDNPTKNGYIFSNWYTDEACTKSYNFDTSVTTNITLYAKWLKCNHADSTEQPTCTKSATCTICNGVIAAFGHDFSVQQHDDNSHWMKCSRCDATDGGAAHIWDDGEITVQPTCTVAGEKRYACAECGVKKTESIDAKGHNLVIHDAKAATCVEIGWEAYVTCRNCNYTTYKEIAATGNHTYEWQSKNGQYWKKCNMCNEKTAKKNIARLEKSGILRRVIRGVYDKPKFSNLLNEYVSPDIDEIARALARNYNWSIAPSGNTALNLLGLSTQVPASFEYISTGPYRSYDIGKMKLRFSHRANKTIEGMSWKSAMVIEALKAIGKDSINDKTIYILRKRLTEDDKERLLSEARQTTSWIYSIIKTI